MQKKGLAIPSLFLNIFHDIIMVLRKGYRRAQSRFQLCLSCHMSTWTSLLLSFGSSVSTYLKRIILDTCSSNFIFKSWNTDLTITPSLSYLETEHMEQKKAEMFGLDPGQGHIPGDLSPSCSMKIRAG